MKDMIRRSGENIAAAEVEEVIMRHPSVRLAAVLAVEDELRGEEVLAYVVPGDGVPQEDVSPEVLSAFCADRLATVQGATLLEIPATICPARRRSASARRRFARGPTIRQSAPGTA